MVVRWTVAVCVLAVVAYLWLVEAEDEPVTPKSTFLTDYSQAREGSCVQFAGPGGNDLGLTIADCAKAALRIGAVLPSTDGECPHGEYKVSRDTRHDAALCLMPYAGTGDCFELDPEDLQRSVVGKFGCTAPRANVRVVEVAAGSCPTTAEIGVSYER